MLGVRSLLSRLGSSGGGSTVLGNVLAPETYGVLGAFAETVDRQLHTSAPLERARRITRERKRKQALKNKAAKEERLRKNPPPLPYKIQLMLKAKGLDGPPKPLRDKDEKPEPQDDTYFADDFTWRRWSLEGALLELRQHYHPTLLDRPDGLVYAKLEFDLRAQKKDRYLEAFSKMVPIIHSYERGAPDRAVLAFVPDPELEKIARDAGALMAGGAELVQEIVKGRVDIADIDHFVAHEDMLAVIAPLGGTLRDKMPRAQENTVDADVAQMVKTFSKGMFITVEKVRPSLGIADEPDYGFCEATIGRLDMPPQQLLENLTAMMEKLLESRPKRKDPKDTGFITRCQLKMDKGPSVDPFKPVFSIRHDLIHDKRLLQSQPERAPAAEAASVKA